MIHGRPVGIDLDRELRIRGLSNFDLAKKTGLSLSTVKRARQQKSIGIDSAEAIAQVLVAIPKKKGMELLYPAPTAGPAS